MGVGFGIIIKDSGMIQTVYPNLAMHMNDVIVFHDNPNVIDNAFSIIEKGQISSLRFLDKT